MSVDYDGFAAMSPLERNDILPTLTAENKSELVTTHFQRFLDSNRQELSPEQISLVEECIGHIRPEVYEHPDENQAWSEEMEKRIVAIFPREILVKFHMEAFKNSGRPRNPISRAIARGQVRATASELETVREALRDIALLPAAELRARRYAGSDLHAILSGHFVDRDHGVPAEEEFWDLIADREVSLAARHALALLSPRRNRPR
jgi:hypothetical protein